MPHVNASTKEGLLCLVHHAFTCSIVRSGDPFQGAALCSSVIARQVDPLQSFWPFRMRFTVGCDVLISLASRSSLQPESALISFNKVEISLSIETILYGNG